MEKKETNSNNSTNDSNNNNNSNSEKENASEIENFYLPTEKYSMEELIGKGAYGTVCKATDFLLERKVAIKKITQLDNSIIAKRTLREIKILNRIKHENLIEIFEIYKKPTKELKEIYLVMDLMESDLENIIYSSQTISTQHIQWFLFQILSGIKFLHSHNIIHRDLKPSNLLVNSNCDLKIIDFGLARLSTEDLSFEQNNGMTQYVTTRYYRAPECVLNRKYTSKIDVWSIGCILVEFYLREIVFKGQDYIDQLHQIFKVIGTPSIYEFKNVCDSNSLKFIENIPKFPKISWKEILEQKLSPSSPTPPPLAIDLIEKMITFDSEERFNSQEALSHSFLSEFYDSSEESPIENTKIELESDETLSLEEIKELMEKEIQINK